MPKTAIIIGTGLAGLASGIRLQKEGYRVKFFDKFHQAGGRLNEISKDGFIFDMAPTFFSMSYEFEELLKDCNIEPLFEFQELDPLYSVYFRNTKKKYRLYRDPEKLAKEFAEVEPDFEKKFRAYMEDAGGLFHDTINKIVKRNFNSFWSYAWALMTVPPKHLPKLLRNFWNHVNRYFESNEVREIVSLVSFFLGGTPFDTPAVYTLLSYTEFIHDGYHNVKGGMYRIVEGMEKYLIENGAEFRYNIEVNGFEANGNKMLGAFKSNEGELLDGDVFIVNGDAALFRGEVFKRSAFSEQKLHKKQWTMAPFTMYVGIEGKLPALDQHNYFLGNNFKRYAQTVFTEQFGGEKPYYYVNVPSKNNNSAAPEGDEALFFLCPVPDKRKIPEWKNKEQFADEIIEDFGNITGVDIRNRIKTKVVLSPDEWETAFNLYKGSGLGLGHSLTQMAWLRPKNVDEQFKNVFYTGASTIPGTGLPMAMISAKLTVEQIVKRYGPVS
jgi:phytoene desaturase